MTQNETNAQATQPDDPNDRVRNLEVVVKQLQSDHVRLNTTISSLVIAREQDRKVADERYDRLNAENEDFRIEVNNLSKTIFELQFYLTKVSIHNNLVLVNLLISFTGD